MTLIVWVQNEIKNIGDPNGVFDGNLAKDRGISNDAAFDTGMIKWFEMARERTARKAQELYEQLQATYEERPIIFV